MWAAILGSAAISGGASIFSGIEGSNAATNAAQLQSTSDANALAFQKQVYGQQQQNLQPFVDNGASAMPNAAAAIGGLSPYTSLGSGAVGQLGQLYGIGTGANGANGAPNYSAFTNSPDYNFAYQQGLGATTNTLNASGQGGMSGSGLAALTNFGQGLASQQYGNYFSRLMGLAGVGQSAAGTAIQGWTGLAGIGANAATGGAQSAATMSNGIANTTQAQGQALASGVVGSANALGGAATGVGNAATGAAGNYMQYNLMQSLMNNKAGSGYAPSASNGNPFAMAGGSNVPYQNAPFSGGSN